MMLPFGLINFINLSHPAILPSQLLRISAGKLLLHIPQIRQLQYADDLFTLVFDEQNRGY